MKTDIKFKRYIKGDLNQVKDVWFYPDKHKEWGLNVKMHRLDGPAVINIELGLPSDKPNKTYEWYYHGEKVNCIHKL